MGTLQLLALIGGDFADAGDDVCGVALSLRTGEDYLSLWHKTADDEATKELLRCVFNLLVTALL